MNTLTRSVSFWIGFIVSAAFFVIKNGLEIYQQSLRICFDCDKGFGFPFRFYESGTVLHDKGVLWFGLFADILVISVVSIGIGAFTYLLVSSLKGRLR